MTLIGKRACPAYERLLALGALEDEKQQCPLALDLGETESGSCLDKVFLCHRRDAGWLAYDRIICACVPASLVTVVSDIIARAGQVIACRRIYTNSDWKEVPGGSDV